VIRAPRGKTIAGALLAALILASIAIAGNSISGSAHSARPVPNPATALEVSKKAYKGPTVGRSYKNDVSRPVRAMAQAHGAMQSLHVAAENPSLLGGKELPDSADPVVQRTLPKSQMPSPMLNFDGIPFPGVNCNCAPPDTNGEVGLDQYVQIVNQGFQVFDKSTGNSIFGPVDIQSLWTNFGGPCEFTGRGDPVVLYDQLANRWVITQFAVTTTVTDECIAVSTSSDATGTFARYGFHLGEDFFDYPKFGVWPDAYYMGMNVFNSSGTAFLGPQPFAFDRAAMLAGNPATFVTFRDPSFFNPSSDQFMPADLDGIVPPPAGNPNPFMSTGTNPNWPLYRFHVDFGTPANSTFTLGGTLTPAPFSVICGGGACVPQLGGDVLDTLGDRGMFRSAYRNFGDHEALVGNMTVASGGVAGVRWFELNNVTSGSPSFVQQGTYQPDSTWRWMASAAMDHSGDLAVGFSASSASINPQIRYAGRLAGDPPGELSQGEATLFNGTGSQLDTFARWGDYSDMTVDPVDDCTFWYTQEYYESTSSFNWRTRIGNFKFPSCTALPTGTLEGTVTDSGTSQPISGATIQVTPLGASTTSGPDGHYSLTLPVDTYDVTASHFGYVTQTANGVAITEGQTTTQDFALVAAPSHTVSGNVRDGDGNALANATVTILGTPIPPVTTDATGFYSFASVPEGEYDLRAEAGRCNTAQTQHLVVDGDETLDFALAQRHDGFGYFCRVVRPNYIEGDTSLGLSGDDSSVQVSLPFGFSLYGQTYNTAFVATNGFLNFLAPDATFVNGSIPSQTAPNGAIYPFWDDLFMDGSSTAWTKLIGSAPDRQFVIEWRNVTFFSNRTPRVDFEVVLYENGQILTQYRNIANDGQEKGNSATLGIENAAGDDAFQYSFNEPTIGSPDFAVFYCLEPATCFLPPSGSVQGNVTDANDDGALAGAQVKAIQNGITVRQAKTDADGFYRLQLPVGDYTLEASKTNYQTESADVTISEDQTTTHDFVLQTPRGEVSPTSLEFVVQRNETQTKTLTLSNTGGMPMLWDVKESGGGAALPSRQQGSKLLNVKLSKDELASPAWLGNHAHGYARRVDAGSPLAPTWSTIASYPVGIMDNSADTIDGKEYSVGGVDSSFNIVNSGYVYDPGANSWSPIANMPVAREKPGVVAANGLLYVSGGWDSSGTPIAETDVYDPSTDSWSTVAPNPSPTAAPGVAVADGKLYFVGGCADAFCTPSAHVARYDPAANSWDSAASYPTTDSWEACGGISGKVYCSGGVSGGTTFSSGNAYDPGSDSWSPIAAMPIDLWASVSGGANGMLVVSSGVTNGFSTITNQGFTYDPSADSWTALPNAQFARYRGGGSCGFYKIGGSSGGFTPTPDSEKLSELDQCAAFTDVPWLSESPTEGTINPGGHTDVQVTVDTHGLAPGDTFQAILTFRTNSGRRPNLQVPVRLVVPALGLNSGGGAYTGVSGDPWLADRAYTATNQAGYIQQPRRTASTRSAIGGTLDDPLYQNARISPMTYRISGLPDGVYRLELKFAEIQNKNPGQRQFDVIVNGSPYLIAFDISALVGRNFALDRTTLVSAVNGEITVQLANRQAHGEPILNAIRVGHAH
jgi:N-acetylneuraminic acid mutarotase